MKRLASIEPGAVNDCPLPRLARRARLVWSLLSHRAQFASAGLLMTLLSFGLSMLIAGIALH